MALPTIPPLDPSIYRWLQSPSDPRILQRLTIGAEAWVGLREPNAEGQYNFYLNTSLRTVDNSAKGLSLAHLGNHIAAALLHLRFLHPEIACTAAWNGPGRPHIQYTPPTSGSAALAWARETVQTRATPLGGQEVAAEDEKARRKSAVRRSAPSVTVSVVADAPGGDIEAPLLPVARVDVLCYFNHIYWDGISGRMFVGELLRRVGERWGRWGDADPGPLESDEYNWGEEVTNLSEPMLDACRVDVGALQGNSEFIEARDEFIRVTMKSGSSWGLPVSNGSDNPRTVFHTFSVSETSAIIRAVKARVGAGHTISHLGHAATALTLIKIRPPPPGATLVSPIPADGRRFLRDGLAARQYGCCQAGAVVDFGPLADWVVEDWSNADAVRTMLAKGCRCVKEGYDYWLQKEFQLPVDASKSSFLADLLSSTTPSFTGSDTPGFASDGVSDRYIPGEVTTPSGEALFTVDNCFFFLDSYSPGLGIRMEGWKGATMLGFCFNDGSFAAEDARAFLEEMAGLMLMFAQ